MDERAEGWRRKEGRKKDERKEGGKVERIGRLFHVLVKLKSDHGSAVDEQPVVVRRRSSDRRQSRLLQTPGEREIQALWEPLQEGPPLALRMRQRDRIFQAGRSSCLRYANGCFTTPMSYPYYVKYVVMNCVRTYIQGLLAKCFHSSLFSFCSLLLAASLSFYFSSSIFVTTPSGRVVVFVLASVSHFASFSVSYLIYCVFIHMSPDCGGFFDSHSLFDYLIQDCILLLVN